MWKSKFSFLGPIFSPGVRYSCFDAQSNQNKYLYTFQGLLDILQISFDYLVRAVLGDIHNIKFSYL